MKSNFSNNELMHHYISKNINSDKTYDIKDKPSDFISYLKENDPDALPKIVGFKRYPIKEYELIDAEDTRVKQ